MSPFENLGSADVDQCIRGPTASNPRIMIFFNKSSSFMIIHFHCQLQLQTQDTVFIIVRLGQSSGIVLNDVVVKSAG
jgi:hypothetical protein